MDPVDVRGMLLVKEFDGKLLKAFSEEETEGEVVNSKPDEPLS